MNQKERIRDAYKELGGEQTFYDGMITCSTLPGKAVCRLVWGMSRNDTLDYLSAAFAGIPEGFSGKLLEIPVGTGILTMPLYRQLPSAEITCMDYSPHHPAESAHWVVPCPDALPAQASPGNNPYR